VRRKRPTWGSNLQKGRAMVLDAGKDANVSNLKLCARSVAGVSTVRQANSGLCTPCLRTRDRWHCFVNNVRILVGSSVRPHAKVDYLSYGFGHLCLPTSSIWRLVWSVLCML
jgi:hypothetical protein